MSEPELVVVGEFQNRIEAEVACGALNAAEIEATLSSDDVGGQYAGVWVDGVRLLVRAEDEARAKEVLGVEGTAPEAGEPTAED